MNRDELKRTLANLSIREAADLIVEAHLDRKREEAHKTLARSDDPLGTIRLSPGKWGQAMMLVRVAGYCWHSWIEDNHALAMADHEVKWNEFPVVGMMPTEWIEKQQEYQREYE